MRFKRPTSPALLAVAMASSLSACALLPASGVSVDAKQVVSEIKGELRNTYWGTVAASNQQKSCDGSRNAKSLTPTWVNVTVTLFTQDGSDQSLTGSGSKLPLLSVLASPSLSRDTKTQTGHETDYQFFFDIDPPSAVKVAEASDLGKSIAIAQQSLVDLANEQPCFGLNSITILRSFDVVTASTADFPVGFRLVYSVDAKTTSSYEKKNSVKLEIHYDKRTPPAGGTPYFQYNIN